jgi:hypothetical protein
MTYIPRSYLNHLSLVQNDLIITQNDIFYIYPFGGINRFGYLYKNEANNKYYLTPVYINYQLNNLEEYPDISSMFTNSLDVVQGNIANFPPQTFSLVEVSLNNDFSSTGSILFSETETYLPDVNSGYGPSINSILGAGGDPHIYPIIGEHYFLPHKEKCYLLYDNRLEDRVIITAKCWFLPKNVKNTSKFKNYFMDNTTFFKYINIYYNNENLTIDMETLRPVKYTNMIDVNKCNLGFINNETSFEFSNYIEDALIFKKYYNGIKLKKYKINFDGKSRIIKLKNGYEIKLSFDLNCADHRNEIKIINANYSNAIGALISEKSLEVVDCLIPQIN